MIKYGSQELFTPNKIFFIGDVHGSIDEMESVIEQIEAEITPLDHIVFLGDLINRGPDSPGVLVCLRDLRNKYPGQVFVTRGNHEHMLLMYLSGGNTSWMNQPYSRDTLNQFQQFYNLPTITPQSLKEALEKDGVLEVINSFLPYYETEQIIASHAPLDYTILMIHGIDHYEEDLNDPDCDPKPRPILDKLEYELMWQFADENRELKHIKKFHICGHQFKHHKQPRIFKTRAYIDTGCGAVAGRPLTCLVYPGKKIIQSK